jgi:hypothetical protein
MPCEVSWEHAFSALAPVVLDEEWRVLGLVCWALACALAACDALRRQGLGPAGAAAAGAG